MCTRILINKRCLARVFLFVLMLTIIFLCKVSCSYAATFSLELNGEELGSSIMFNYMEDGYRLYYYGDGIDEVTIGDQYIRYSRNEIIIPPEEGTGDEPQTVIYYQIDLDKNVKPGDYLVSFTDGNKTCNVFFTDAFDTSTMYDYRIKDLDGYFITDKTTVTEKDRIALLGNARFNYIEEGTHTFYLRLRKSTGMVMGNNVKVDSDGTVSARVLDDKTMAITLDKDVTSGVHRATLTFDRANPWLKKIYKASFDVEFTDCASSGSMDAGFFIPEKDGSFEIYQAGRGDVVYSYTEDPPKYWTDKANVGDVTINTKVSNSIGYAPELNYDYKNITAGDLTSSNPLITVSCEMEPVSADDWVQSYSAKKPYIIATLADNAPAGTHSAIVNGQLVKGNGVYDLTYTVTFEKDVPPVESVFDDVPPNAWYKDYLQKAYSNNIIGGMSASEYAPQSNLTHGQIIVMVANLHNLQNGGTYDFQSHSVSGGHWCSAYLEYCKAEGMLDDRFDGCLNDTVDRGEMAYYFAHAISEDSYRQKKTVDLIDIEGVPYAEDIEKLASANIVGGYSDKTFRADNPVTRAETAVFISNIIDAINE